MKRSIWILLFALLFGIMIAGCDSGTNEATTEKSAEKVIIGTQTLIGPEAIARVNGWLQETIDIDVEIVFFDAGRDVINAMASKSIDIGLCGSVPAALAVANGVDCKIVYVQSVLEASEALVVRSDLDISDAEGLFGKTIASTFSSTAHYSLLKYLEVNNIDPFDVDIIDMKASEIVAAYIRGDIDGAFTWDPHVSTMINEGGYMLTNAGEVARLGYATMDVNIVDRVFAENNPDVVKAFIQCMERAVELYKNDPEAASQALAIDNGLTAEECFEQTKGITFLTLDVQRGEQWFGSSALANKLYDTGFFLYKQGDVTSEPSHEVFLNAVSGQYLG